MKFKFIGFGCIMTLTTTMLVSCLVVSASAMASNYPPDYGNLKCKKSEDGLVTVCQKWVYLGGSALQVFYRGKLLERYPAEVVKFNVKFLYQDSPRYRAFQMHDHSVGGEEPVARGVVSNVDYDCHWRTETKSYLCEKPTAEMKDVLFWADRAGGVNAWDLEVWFEANQQFDSGPNGTNYKFRFEGN